MSNRDEKNPQPSPNARPTPALEKEPFSIPRLRTVIRFVVECENFTQIVSLVWTQGFAGILPDYAAIYFRSLKNFSVAPCRGGGFNLSVIWNPDLANVRPKLPVLVQRIATALRARLTETRRQVEEFRKAAETNFPVDLKSTVSDS